METDTLAESLHDGRNQQSSMARRIDGHSNSPTTTDVRTEKCNNEDAELIQALAQLSGGPRPTETELCYKHSTKSNNNNTTIHRPLRSTETKPRPTKRSTGATSNRRKSEFPNKSVAGSHTRPPGVRRRRNAEQTTNTEPSTSQQPPNKRSKLTLKRTESFGREHAVASTNAKLTGTRESATTPTKRNDEKEEIDGFIDINIFPKTTIVNSISVANETSNTTERNDSERKRLDNSDVMFEQQRVEIRHSCTEGFNSEDEMGRKHGLRNRNGKRNSTTPKRKTPVPSPEECILEENDRRHSNHSECTGNKTTPLNPTIHKPPNAPRQHNRYISQQSQILGTEVPKRRLTWERQGSPEILKSDHIHANNEFDCIDGSETSQPSTSRNIPSTSKTSERKTPESSTEKQGIIQNSERKENLVSDNSNEYTITSTYSLYSFIYWGYNPAKIGIGSNGKPRNPYQRPNYIYFNHGDHLHIIYLCSQRNHTRTIKRIAEDLGANQLDFAAIRTTDIAISRTPTKFILYLIRKGYNTMTIVNKGLQADPELCEFIKTIVAANSDAEPDPNFERCTQFQEAKKLERVSSNRLTDTFIPLIKEHNITTFNELTQHMTQEMLCSFVNQWGPSWSRSAEHLIQMLNTLNKNEIKNATLWDNYANFIDDYNPPESHVEWMENLFKQNRVDFIEFGAKLKIIVEKHIVKLNCFVISGKPNSGKSMITRMISAPLKPTIVPKGNEQSSFQFQGLIGSTCALLEEPVIWPFNVQSFKTLIGGDLHATDVKNKNQENVERTPFFISTNEEKLGSRCDPIDMVALETRNYLFRFNEVIAHKKVIGTIKRPPALLSDKLLPWMILQKADIIDEAFSALLELEQDIPR